MKRITLLLLMLSLMLIPMLGVADGLHEEKSCSTLVLDITVGYDGMMTYGRAMPIQIRLENKGADLQGTLAVNTYVDRTRYNRHEIELTLASGAVKEIVLPVRVGSKQEVYTVEVWQNGEKLCAVNAAPERLIQPSSLLVGVLSQQPQRLAYMNLDMETDALLRGEYIQTIPLTEKNFPDQKELLSSFGMLLVDGFDVGLLSAQQRATLQQWLEDGHILVVGGGAQAGVAWPFFTAMTGLVPGELTAHADITPALMAWLGVTGAPLGKTVMLTAATPDNVLIADADTPLIWRNDVGNGIVYTTAFELSDAALTEWSGMRTFWQRLMLKDCYALYQRGLNVNDYNASSNYMHITSQLPLHNDVPLLPAVLIAVAILLLGGVGAYLLLKHMDKRQLLWFVLPALALVATAAVYAVMLSSSAIQPTVMAVSVMDQQADGTSTMRNSLAVASSRAGEQLVSVDTGNLLAGAQQYWYEDYDDESRSKEPTTLNYRYVTGTQTAIGVNFTKPWEVQSFRVEQLPTPGGQISAAVWMEKDGLHGFIINGLSVTLEEGIFLCKYGFCTIPELQPGERYDLLLKKDVIPTQTNYSYKDGSMYESLAGSSFNGYEMVNEFIYKKSERQSGESVPYDRVKSIKCSLFYSLADNSYYNRNTGYDYTTPKFHYMAMVKNPPLQTVRMNGKEITRGTQYMVLNVSVPYQDSSASAYVYRVPGMDAAVTCQVDQNGVPTASQADTSNTANRYYRLSDSPTFMFEVEGLAQMNVERLAFYLEYAPNYITSLIYDGSEWIPFNLSEEIADPQRFVQEDGRIYIRFTHQAGYESYMEITAPTMLLEGRMV